MAASYQAHCAPMEHQRHIKSFVLRAGRTTAAQERALKELWPVYGLEAVQPWELDAIFGRSARRCCEIGFGSGEVIGQLAELNPDTDYLGIEVHKSGVGRLLLQAQKSNLQNLRIACTDAVEILKDRIADESFDEILVFFPDPWHKKRHHKRRLIDANFVTLLARKMRLGGVLRMATDWQAYAEQMLQVCNAEPCFDSHSAQREYVPRPDFRPPTRFERRGERLGHGVWDLAYVKARQTPQA